ncbi:arylsulfatase [Joostella sp.]|uniref:arylsulfatase n=1 Tax=Joostella sp. TaxID=2231138 RepID=UPI003A9064D1
MKFINYLAVITFVVSFGCKKEQTAEVKKEVTSVKQPNVIIVMTDDQGYGDIGAHGNEIIQTPNIDQLHEESVHLTNFHVGTTCAPTRAGLLTGKYSNRTGVWHTVGGYSLLREEEETLANVLNDAGYQTALFGKWHLGDTYPSRPMDKGFQYAAYHGGGGIGQTPDIWKNDYFDDTYFVNGKPKKFEGYCTDVWFNEAMSFIENNKEKPFFCYLALNAPHSPFNVPQEYYDLYKEAPIPESMKRFYGMITNVDDNLKRLEDQLERLNIEDNTIIVFMTDNGTSAGYTVKNGKVYGYNANMRGTKASEYEGGHRVPFFIKYPNGNIKGGKDVNELTAHIDVLPTIASLCNVDISKRDLDGTNITGLLNGNEKSLSRDYLITDTQRIQTPEKWKNSSVMSGSWRLVNREELYNIAEDAGQEHDISDKYPEKVAKFQEYYEEWWSNISSSFDDVPVIKVGTENQNPVEFTCHDSHVHDSHIAWNQNFIRKGERNAYEGYFELDVADEGTYEIEISRWPLDIKKPINAGLQDGIEATQIRDEIFNGKAFNFKSGGISLGDYSERKPIADNSISIKFERSLNKGRIRFNTWFTNLEGKNVGAYYIKISKK